MKERPILFSAPMVRAILAGTKTQTRRIVDRLPTFGRVREFQRSDTKGYDWAFRDHHDLWNEVDDTRLRQWYCPYGIPGNRLWVRETWARDNEDGTLIYRASREHNDTQDWERERELGLARWRPGIHMPRRASRILLEVTDVRVEQLHAISRDDIVAEGVRIPATAEGRPLIDISTKHGPSHWLRDEQQLGDERSVLRAHWNALWCEINGIDSFNANPWVWAISFKRITGADA